MPIRVREVEVESPCHEDWDAMSVDEARRFCAACKEHVHDLSAMSTRQARRFLDLHADDDVCISYVPRTNGTIAPRPPRIVPVSRLAGPRRGLAVAGMVVALGACTSHGNHEALEIASEDPPATLASRAIIPIAVGSEADEPCDVAEDTEVIESPRVVGRLPRVKGKRARISDDDF